MQLSQVAVAVNESFYDDSLPTEIFPAFEEFLQPSRFKVAYGGRGSAKTRTFITILKNNVLYFGWRIVCFREFMKSIADSVYQEFVDEIMRCGEEEHFEILKAEIRCKHSGGVIRFDGLHNNQQKVKGYSGFDAAFIEEAENVSADSWKFLIPTLRKAGSEIWVAYNPDDALSATHQMFVVDRKYPDMVNGQRYCIVKKINYTDNPRFPEELRIDMELMKANDYELYRHVYLGECVGNSALAIIKPYWIEAVIDAHLKLNFKKTGIKIGGFDVSDEGPDANAFVYHQNFIYTHVEEWRDIDPNTAARHVFNQSLEHKVGLVYYDNIGVGAGAKGAIREEKTKYELNIKNKSPVFAGFTANSSVWRPESLYIEGKKNVDMFANLKAQTWWTMADRFKNTYDAINGKPYDPAKLISISSADIEPKILEKLKGELAQPRREFLNGKFQVEPKKAMKKRGVVSPNLADAFIMSGSPEQKFNIDSLL